MNTIHATAVIGPGVVLGEGNVIGPHAVLIGPLVVGDDNWFGPGVVLGGPPEVRGFEHTAGWDEPGPGAGVRIGHRNVFREHALVNQGWKRETTIGSSALVMNKGYIAHDCELADGVTLASSVSLGGHVRVGAGANLGLGAQVHQRRIIGPGAMVGMGTAVTRDVPPYAKVYGVPGRIHGVNVVPLQRTGASDDAVAWLRARYGPGFGTDPDAEVPNPATEAPGRSTEAPDLDTVPVDLRMAFIWWAGARAG